MSRLENGGFIGLIIGAVVCGIIAVICVIAGKKGSVKLEEILESMTDEEKNMVRNQTFNKADGKAMFTTNVFIAKTEDLGDKINATILYFDGFRSEYFFRNVKVKKSEPVVANLTRGNFVTSLLKYDKDMCFYDFKKFI